MLSHHIGGSPPYPPQAGKFSAAGAKPSASGLSRSETAMKVRQIVTASVIVAIRRAVVVPYKILLCNCGLRLRGVPPLLVSFHAADKDADTRCGRCTGKARYSPAGSQRTELPSLLLLSECSAPVHGSAEVFHGEGFLSRKSIPRRFEGGRCELVIATALSKALRNVSAC